MSGGQEGRFAAAQNTMPDNQRGKDLAKRWGLNVQQALYRKTGDRYHQLKKFPGALLDADGYVIFEREELFKAFPQLRIGKDPSRHGGWANASRGMTYRSSVKCMAGPGSNSCELYVLLLLAGCM